MGAAKVILSIVGGLEAYPQVESDLKANFCGHGLSEQMLLPQPCTFWP